MAETARLDRECDPIQLDLVDPNFTPKAAKKLGVQLHLRRALFRRYRERLYSLISSV